MAGGEEVNFRMRSNDPEPVVLALKCVHGRPLVQVPDPNRLILARGEDEVLMRVEETAASVLEVASACIDLKLGRVSLDRANK